VVADVVMVVVVMVMLLVLVVEGMVVVVVAVVIVMVAVVIVVVERLYGLQVSITVSLQFKLTSPTGERGVKAAVVTVRLEYSEACFLGQLFCVL
jgi:hypothetical protein